MSNIAVWRWRRFETGNPLENLDLVADSDRDAVATMKETKIYKNKTCQDPQEHD